MALDLHNMVVATSLSRISFKTCASMNNFKNHIVIFLKHLFVASVLLRVHILCNGIPCNAIIACLSTYLFPQFVQVSEFSVPPIFVDQDSSVKFANSQKSHSSTQVDKQISVLFMHLSTEVSWSREPKRKRRKSKTRGPKMKTSTSGEYSGKWPDD